MGGPVFRIPPVFDLPDIIRVYIDGTTALIRREQFGMQSFEILGPKRNSFQERKICDLREYFGGGLHNGNGSSPLS